MFLLNEPLEMAARAVWLGWVRSVRCEVRQRLQPLTLVNGFRLQQTKNPTCVGKQGYRFLWPQKNPLLWQINRDQDSVDRMNDPVGGPQVKRVKELWVS